MSEQLDRIEAKLDGLIEKLVNKQSPFDRVSGEPFTVIAGVEKILGPKPSPSEATDGTVWRREASKISKIYSSIPEAFIEGSLTLAAATGVVPVFFERFSERKAGSEVLAVLDPGLTPWVTPAENFIGSNVQGLIRAVLDSGK